MTRSYRKIMIFAGIVMLVGTSLVQSLNNNVDDINSFGRIPNDSPSTPNKPSGPTSTTDIDSSCTYSTSTTDPDTGLHSDWSPSLTVTVKNGKFTSSNQGPVINLNTSKSFDNIQPAIDDPDTEDKHWILVKSVKTYYEHVTINKDIALIGENGSPIIDGNGSSEPIITIVNDSVTVKNFKLVNGNTWNFYCSGVQIISTDNTNIRNLDIQGVHQGIWIQESTNAVIHDNMFDGCSILIYGEKPEHYLHDMKNNIVDGKPLCYYKNQMDVDIPPDAVSIILVKCKNLNIEMTSSDVNIGVLVAYSSDITISNSNFRENDFGISSCNSSNCVIENCNISSNKFTGLALTNCSDVVIQNNVISENGHYGVHIMESSQCSIINNEAIANNELGGLRIYRSVDMRVEYNTFTNNGLFIDGDILDHFVHIVNDNTVNGKGLLYYLNAYKPHPNPKDAGCIIFVNCDGGYIEDIISKNCDVGFEVAFCNGGDIIISDSTASNSNYGIYLCHSSANTVIENCEFSNCQRHGIYLKNSSNVVIEDLNKISHNNGDGIRLEDSDNCRIYNNKMAYNFYAGINLDNSSDNQISFNTLEYNMDGINLLYSSHNCQVDNNTIVGQSSGTYCVGGDGIKIRACNHCTIENNEIQRSGGEGIWLEGGTNNYLTSNNITFNCGNGIQLVNSSYNFITLNIIMFNNWGIRLDITSNDNEIWNNWFAINANGILNPNDGGHAIDDGRNIWNHFIIDPWTKETVGGNWWGDWQPLWTPGLTDENNDEVVDQPRPIKNSLGEITENTDEYPRVIKLEEDKPDCEILKPRKGRLYVNNRETTIPVPKDMIIIFGNIEIEVYAKDIGRFSSDTVSVTFYVDNKFQYTDSEPDLSSCYQWSAWGRPYIGRHTLHIEAKDILNNKQDIYMTVWILAVS